MERKILVVVDMQNDFLTGALRNEDGIKVIDNIKAKLDAADDETIIVFTRDTHNNDYMELEEGKNLPVPHCIKNTKGWEIEDTLKSVIEDLNQDVYEIDKETFGSDKLFELLRLKKNQIDEVELVGVCTDICVISNAIIAKTALPNVPIYVDAACCAGVTPESHDTALAAMKACHIHVTNEGKEPWRK